MGRSTNADSTPVRRRHRPYDWLSGAIACSLLVVAAAGCRSDINQQLLERELRLQEDQIYRLQDELHQKCARLDRELVENSSLRRQLGMPEGTGGPRPAGPPAARSLPSPANAPRSLVPPKIEFVPPPSGLGSASSTQAPTLAPPEVDGLPPSALAPTSEAPSRSLPALRPASPATEAPAAETGGRASALDESDGPAFAPSPTTLGIEPTSASAGAAAIRRLSYEESLAEQPGIARIVLNPSRSGAFDGDADGRSDGLAVVFEPRDADERLVTAAGDVMLAAYDPTSANSEPIAVWEIPARQAIEHFRRSSRARGLHFVLHWPASPPAGDSVRLKARLTTFEGRSFEDEAVLAPVVRAPDPRGN